MSHKRLALTGNFYTPEAIPPTTKLDYFQFFGEDSKFNFNNFLFLVVLQRLVMKGAIDQEGFYKVVSIPGLLVWKTNLYRS